MLGQRNTRKGKLETIKVISKVDAYTDVLYHNMISVTGRFVLLGHPTVGIIKLIY